MSRTPHQNKIEADFPIYHSSFPTADVSPTGPRSALKRVNTPPGLSLFTLMSSDASALAAKSQNHKRSHSAVGRTGVMDEQALGASGGCNSAGLTMKPGTSASAMNALQIGMDSMRSPCFVHKTFGGSINLERVLDECRAEEMTHHNLLQTATGVREVARQLGRTVIKTKIKSVMIVTKARDHALVQLTRDIAEWLMTAPRHGKPYGVKVHVDAKLEKSSRFDADGLYKDRPIIGEKSLLNYWTPETCVFADTFDIVITLGGDGTVLYTSWLFQRIVPPVISFNLGSLGFLTNFKYENMHADLDRCLNEGYRANMRMRFTCTVFRSVKRSTEVLESEQFDVLNEIVIDRGPSPWVSNLELFMDEKLLTIVQADGLILSTPTGSTAYSLSAGGSLVHPSIPAILVSPICPHTLSFRPMLLPDSAVVKVCVPKSSRATAYISFDGRNRVELRKGDYVEIQASRFPFPTVAKEEGEWVDSVCRTFQWNQRERQKPIGTPRQRLDDDDSDDEEQVEEWDIDDSALGSSIGGIYGMTPRSESVGSLSGWGTPERQDSVTGLAAQLNQMRVGKA